MSVVRKPVLQPVRRPLLCWSVLVVVLAFLASACGGEVTDDTATDGDDAADSADSGGDGDDTSDDGGDMASGADAATEVADDGHAAAAGTAHEAGPNTHNLPHARTLPQLQATLPRRQPPVPKSLPGCPAAPRRAACIEATEDHDAVITMNSSGFQGTANLCLVEQQQAAFISTQGQPLEWMERGEGRLVSISTANEESLQFLVAWLLESGDLEGHVIGVASPDTPGQPESVEEGLVQPLRDAGLEVVFDIIGCDGGTVCSNGVGESVTRMRDAGISVFFNVLNILSAPGYIAEMVNQGFEPGDVQFYASDFNSATSELVSSQIATNPEAGALYQGAIMVDYRSTGDYRAPDYTPSGWQQTCADLYNEHNPDGNTHTWEDQGGDSGFGMVASVCSITRIAFRALYDAGDNPTLADVHAALQNLGPVDNGPMTPASVVPGKTQSPDALQSMVWDYPCEQPRPYTIFNSEEAVCITGNNDWWPAPRS